MNEIDTKVKTMNDSSKDLSSSQSYFRRSPVFAINKCNNSEKKPQSVNSDFQKDDIKFNMNESFLKFSSDHYEYILTLIATSTFFILNINRSKQ